MDSKSCFVVVLALGAGIISASGCGSGNKSNADALGSDGRGSDSLRLDSSGSGDNLVAIDVPFAGDLANRDGSSTVDVGSAGLDGRDTSGIGQSDIAIRDGHAVDTVVSDADQARDLAHDGAKDGSSDTPASDLAVVDAAPSYS